MKCRITRHHRKPRSRGGSDTFGNISKVPEHQHQAWHLLFQNHTPEAIAKIINDVWLDPDYELVLVKKASIKAASVPFAAESPLIH